MSVQATKLRHNIFSGTNFLVIVNNFCSVTSSLLLRIYCFSANLLSETSNLLSLKRKKPSQILDLQRLMQYCLYPERGSNPHAFQHRCLRPTCLPIPTSGRKAVAKVIVFFRFCKLISKNFADRHKISIFALINWKRAPAFLGLTRTIYFVRGALHVALIKWKVLRFKGYKV